MTSDPRATASTPSRKRRLIAAVLCPLGATPLLAAGALLDGTEMMAGSSLAAILWVYVGGGLVAAYGLALPAWLIMIWTKAPHRAWGIIPAFMAAFGLGGLIGGQSVGGIVMGAVLGLPIAIAYCLLVAASWRMGAQRPNQLRAGKGADPRSAPLAYLLSPR